MTALGILQDALDDAFGFCFERLTSRFEILVVEVAGILEFGLASA
jgi:hypothetical protein